MAADQRSDPDSIEETDVAIIGAGPVGLFAVFECGMLDMSCRVIDVLDVAGGQCAALYPEKPIYDIPGWPRIAAGDLIAKLIEQAEPFAPVYHLGQRVETIADGPDSGFLLTTSAETRIRCRAVMVAGGVGAFGPNRPPIKGITTYEGKSVHYLVTRREDFRDKRIVIAGGGDSAVDWAISLAEIAAHVDVVHRREKFRAAPESVQRMHALAETDRLDLVVPYQLSALDGDDGTLSAVIVKSLEGDVRRLPADALLPFFGLATNLGPIAGWGLEIDHGRVRIDPATMESTRPGIYAIGDITAYPGKLKLILTGFAEAAAAAHAAFARVHPGEALHFEYSTLKGVPGRG